MANIVRLDIMEGKPRTFIADEALENGYFLKIVGKAENDVLGGTDYEAYKVEKADADTELGDLLFHKSVENMYDERLLKKDFVLEAGKPGRGYVPTRNDIVTLPIAMCGIEIVSETPDAEVGDKLFLGADGKLAKSGTLAVAKIEAFEDIVIPMYKGQFGADNAYEDVVQKSVVIRFIIG